MCVRPMNVKGNIVPCGKCFDCKKADRYQWSIRVQDEIKKGTFVTLTYNEENYPGKLIKKHLVDYVKRVRERIRVKEKNINENDRTNVKYFGVGEYGDKFGRAHYHIIINVFDVNVITSSWKYGYVYIGEVSDSSIHYVTKYVQKNSGWKKDEKRKKEVREFRIMSKGIGERWLKEYGEHFKENRLLYRVTGKGEKVGLPRYYKEKLFKGMDLRDKVELMQKLKMEKLVELYKNMLHKDIDDSKRKRYEKYKKMYESMNLLKNNDYGIIRS